MNFGEYLELKESYQQANTEDDDVTCNKEDVLIYSYTAENVKTAFDINELKERAFKYTSITPQLYRNLTQPQITSVRTTVGVAELIPTR